MCTTADCPDGIAVSISNADGRDLPEQKRFLLKWRADGLEGEISSDDYYAYQRYDGSIEFFIFGGLASGVRLNRSHREIALTLLYDDVVIHEDTFPVEWESRVCNHCGDAPWCEPDRTLTAGVEVVLDDTAWSDESAGTDDGDAG